MSSQGLGRGCSNKGYASWGLSVSILALDFPLHHELPIQGDFAPPPGDMRQCLEMFLVLN